MQANAVRKKETLAKVERKHIKAALKSELWPAFFDAGFKDSQIPAGFYQGFHRTVGDEMHFLGILNDKSGLPRFSIEGGWAAVDEGIEELAACDVEQRARLYLRGKASPRIQFGSIANDREACIGLVRDVAAEFEHLDRWLHSKQANDHVRPLI